PVPATARPVGRVWDQAWCSDTPSRRQPLPAAALQGRCPAPADPARPCASAAPAPVRGTAWSGYHPADAADRPGRSGGGSHRDPSVLRLRHTDGGSAPEYRSRAAPGRCVRDLRALHAVVQWLGSYDLRYLRPPQGAMSSYSTPANRIGAGADPASCNRSLRLADEYQKWMARLSATPAASITASLSVGCGCIASMISASVASSLRASTSSESNSVTFSPIMCTPSSSPYFLSKISLTNPSGSPAARARPMAWPGHFAILISRPCS